MSYDYAVLLVISNRITQGCKHDTCEKSEN